MGYRVHTYKLRYFVLSTEDIGESGYGEYRFSPCSDYLQSLRSLVVALKLTLSTTKSDCRSTPVLIRTTPMQARENRRVNAPAGSLVQRSSTAAVAIRDQRKYQ